MVCPVCLNDTGHISKDKGKTYQCDLCMGIHNGEKRIR